MSDAKSWMNMTVDVLPSAGFMYGTDAAKTIDHANESCGVAFQVKEDCSLTGGKVFCQGVTGYSPYYKLQLWPMSTATGGQVDMSGYALAETAAFVGTVSGTWPYSLLHDVSFTSPYTATQGQRLALVLVYSSGTIDGSNYAKWDYISGRCEYINGYLSVLETYSSSSTTWSTSGSYYPSMVCTTNKSYDVGGVLSVVSASQYVPGTGQKLANKITMPAAVDGAGLELHAIGIRLNGGWTYFADGADTFKIGAWNSSGTELIDTLTLDADESGGYSKGNVGMYLGDADIFFGETLTLNSGDVVYYGFETDSGALYNPYHIFGAYETECLRSWPLGSMISGQYWASSSWANLGTALEVAGRWGMSLILSDMHGTSSGGASESANKPTMGVIG